MGNLVGLPVMVVPTGFKKISDPPSNETRRKTTVTTGIYAPPDRDHIVSVLSILLCIQQGALKLYGYIHQLLLAIAGTGTGHGLSVSY